MPQSGKQFAQAIDKLTLERPVKIGRDYSFNSSRVLGSWRGERSGVQILPPPDNAPRSPFASGQHPFIIEFPLKVNELWPITNHRRMREHRNLTLLLNVLLKGRTSLQSRRSQHFWASVPCADNEGHEIKWVLFFGELGEPVIGELSDPAGIELEQVEPEAYYERVGGAGRELRVPTDLDESICRYLQLSPSNRLKFDRATFWKDLASRQWTFSVSASFASLVSATESLIVRGTTHRTWCDQCVDCRPHEAPGPTKSFKDFFEKYAFGAALKNRRNAMYSLRSDILHGSRLMQLDENLDFGWDPPSLNESGLLDELWSLTMVAMRNWLRQPSS